MDEKRRSPRIQFEGPVVVDVERHHTVLGTAANLSVGGMFIDAIDEPLGIAVGASVTVHVRISGSIHELPGTVRWARAGGIGVQFGLLGALQTHAITEAVGRHASSGTRVATLEAFPAVGKKRA